MTTLLDRALAFTGQWEGNIDHMYQCPAGKVTVGVGCQLPFVETALLLPFTPPQFIADDYAAVRALPPGKLASWYGQHTRTRLTQEAIRALFFERCAGFVAELHQAFPNMERFPEPASLALIDLGFNLGVRKLLSWTRLPPAVRSEDWATCAAQCHRKPPVSEARNQATAVLFLRAAAAAV